MSEEKLITMGGSAAALEAAQGSLAGWQPEITNVEQLAEALAAAVDYRGDVTLMLIDGTSVEGYVFNCIRKANPSESFIELFTPTVEEKQRLGWEQISGLAFTGKDYACGERWEDWVKRYNEKKADGGAQ